MKVTPLQALLGFKAIGLALGLRDSDRRIAVALLEHFNRRTGQCDPSLGTLSTLLGLSERTAIRATIRLEGAGLIRKTRHGGNFHRNHYELCWPKFRQIEADWNKRRRANSARIHARKKSPLSGRESHRDADKEVTQTCPSNLLNVTSNSEASIHPPRPRSNPEGSQGLGSEATVAKRSVRRSGFQVRLTSSRDAARIAAQGRWDEDLLRRFGGAPGIYGSIIESIDETLIAGATEAELQTRGGGVDYLIKVLDLRSPPTDEPR
jgi:hypothetical protein